MKVSKLYFLVLLILFSSVAHAVFVKYKTIAEDIAQWQKDNPSSAQNKKIFMDDLKTRINLGIAKQAPKVGMTLSDASFTNQLKQNTTLKNIIGNNNAIITFYRGGWCPYCSIQLRAYQQRLDDFKKLKAVLIAITPETPDNSMNTREKLDLKFTVLTDKNNNYARSMGIVFQISDDLKKIYQQYGIDLSKNNGTNAWELPLTATFVVDKNLKIHHAFVDADYTKREEPTVLIDALVKILPES